MIRLCTSSALFATALSLAACGNESGSNRDQPNASSPAGTNQQAVENSLGTPESPDMMPGVGAPGAGGAGTQPGSSETLANGSSESEASNAQ